jgi:predicted ribosome quality control (RQC) complex YloA/Tae2 family protein
MPFDNYVVGAVANELDRCLAGGRVERVYQPEREAVILCVNTPPAGGNPGGRHNLLLSAESSQPVVYLAERREAGPQNPPAFCMLLRKYLIGARILGIAQVETERILRIGFRTASELGVAEERCLVFELMGRHSNIILLNQEKIVDSVKRISFDVSRVRQTLPGLDYAMPPPGKGVSPLMAEETANAMSGGRGREYYDSLAAAKNYAPTIYYDKNGTAKDFHVFRLNILEGMDAQAFESVSEMLETWYEGRENAVRLTVRSSELTTALKARLGKLYLKKQRLSEEILEAARAEEHRQDGDLITANIWRLSKGMAAAELEDWNSVGQAAGQTPARPESGAAGQTPGQTALGGAGQPALITVALDPRLTPAQNAQRCYKRYSKAKTASVIKASQLEETQQGIDYLESAAWSLELAKNMAEIEEIRDELREAGILRARGARKKQPGAKPRSNAGKPSKGGSGRKRPFTPIEYVLPSGAKVLVGRNNNENDELTMRFAQPTDIWLHTKDIPGSHTILKAGRPAYPDGADDVDAAGTADTADNLRASAGAGNPDAVRNLSASAGAGNPGSAASAEADLRAAAAIAAWHSKARQSEGVPVDFTLVKYVKKPSGAKPGYVIFTHNRTLYVTPKLLGAPSDA